MTTTADCSGFQYQYQHQHQFQCLDADEAVVPPLSRRCGVLNRAKHSNTNTKTNHYHTLGHLGHGSKTGRSGDRSGGGGYVLSGGRGPASPRRPRTRVNGADIYVVRTTKRGLGNAKPCWRCLEWCRWAGVRRIFHWDASAADEDNDGGGGGGIGVDEHSSGGECPSDSTSLDSAETWEKPRGRWEVVKVSSCRVEDCYITSSDGRILCGEVGIGSFSFEPQREPSTTDCAVHRFNIERSLDGSYMEIC